MHTNLKTEPTIEGRAGVKPPANKSMPKTIGKGVPRTGTKQGGRAKRSKGKVGY